MNTTFPPCNLCGKAADKTNSHIFSWFLIKDAVNKPGVKGRENEVVFSLDGEYVKSYIGRGQSAEDKVVPIKGRPMSEKEIYETETENPFSRDNILCSSCENKLNILESIVNDKIISKLRKLSIDDLEIKDLKIDNGDLLRLFVYSLAWRGAIVKVNTFEMKPEHQEILRLLLAKCLGTNQVVLQSNVKENAAEIRSIQIIIDFFEVKGKNDNPINCSISYKPYSMQLNDLGFQLYFDDAPPGDDDPLFQEINKLINGEKYLMKEEEKLHIVLISDKKRQELNTNLYTRKGIETMRSATSKFIIGFIHLLRRQPGPQEIALFQSNLIKRAQAKIESYTDDDQVFAAQETIMELFPWRFQENR